MANLQGINHALRKKIAQLDVVIEELGSELGDTANNLAEAQNVIRGLKNPDIIINGGSVTMDRIQIMETGDIRLLPPTPAPITETCVQAPEPDKNGKKPEKELVNATAS
tara:strand:- start:200 stop:526 length:327 start_codon:yes stop_codon:yes gene_type:complete